MGRHKQPGHRYPNGRLVPAANLGAWLGRISPEDLDAGVYPDGDVRNLPQVRERFEELKRKGLELPRGLPPVWVGHDEHRCPTCGKRAS